MKHWLKALIGSPKKRQPAHTKRFNFLKDITGLIHIGAHTGQERELYDSHGCNVLWIEPNPEVFTILQTNISRYADQQALQALVTDRNEEEYIFHISNNEAASSSILGLKKHKEMWPWVTFTRSIKLSGFTLPTILEKAQIDCRKYQALVMDTQGTELLILQGAVPLLDFFKYIKLEVADFESYEGGCELSHVEHFMKTHSYREQCRERFAGREGIGSYFNIVYEKTAERDGHHS
jgi:FkbM family methyltransferase